MATLETEDCKDGGSIETRGTFSFHYKSLLDHLQGVAHHYRAFIIAAFSVFGALWTVSGAPMELLVKDFRGWVLYFALITVSLACAAAYVLHKYLTEVPQGFEGESREAQRIAHIQRPLWEFRLAHRLLREKLGKLDRELDDLLQGHVYVPQEKPINLQAYMNWVYARPRNLTRMLNVATQLVIRRLPAAVQSVPERPASPQEILKVVESIRTLYAATVEFERDGHRVWPHEKLTRAHELQFGWAAPIRDGIQQTFTFLEEILQADTEGTSRISFTIVFDAPPTVDEYCEELDRIEPHLPEILGDEGLMPS